MKPLSVVGFNRVNLTHDFSICNIPATALVVTASCVEGQLRKHVKYLNSSGEM